MKRDDTGAVSPVPEEGPALEPAQLHGGGANAVEKWLLTRLLAGLGNPPVRLDLWDGEQLIKSEQPPVAIVEIRDRSALWKLVAHPYLQFGELYADGRIGIQGDLAGFLEAMYRRISGRRKTRYKLARQALARHRRNGQHQARDNIHRHYDLGNDFYRLWLDERMLYTCAYFSDPDMDLEAAQVAKMDLVARKLRLQPGDRVVEAGCGWGALALHMARNYGVTVKAYNISREQLAYARESVARAGLEGQVEFVEGDYRDIAGRFDVFVSVGMVEHVGPAQYPELAAVIDRSLEADGRGLIHTIGRDRPAPLNPWIEKRIFPGAYPPSLSEMSEIFEPYNFTVLDVENLRLHYARTLAFWLQRFEASAERIEAMFDAAFVRAWRMYLASSIAAFRAGQMQLFQFCFTRNGVNDIPWTREYLYR